MPQHYTVPTKNAFAALDDSDYEDTVLAQPDEQATAAASTTTRPARQQAEREKLPRQQQQRQQTNRNAQQPARRPRPATEGGVEEEAITTGAGAGAGATAQRRGERRPRRGSAHAVPTEGRPHKREFDRHSGTGRGHELKRSGHGTANWGVATDNLEETPIMDAPVDVDEEAGAATTTPGAPQEEPAAAPKAKSYAEYMAEMEEKKRALLPAPKAELVVEDPDKLEKEGYSVYTKDIVGPQRLTKEESEAEREEVNKKKVLHLAEIAEESGVHLFGRGGRGGRGGRDNRQASGPRKDTPTRQQQQQQPPRREINLADSAAFPTLQAH
eukprot:Protomagalhaensia_sp_Gyna_25__3728@NODE_334_length_3838_cov_597_592788_g261_i0_p2_GENE_NODE_334_length_3838_cov_597_592788_g261_i0NODE_334_length_3838_cov_597_592788_g261_i0_p2_ORF_typecomplete_len327_score76_16HABP4_PAIRBP1/PF04774_15/1_8e04HABP4_PAIRBP1/PF04774_15/1_8e15HABP4_PAIRBP1/PF04774_15/1_8e04IHABP4_N/PF16174_5/0_002IHABP4_N/PF16174_5/1_4e04_NODE_334_length_3838_cov_597_592788_g261_i04121392